MKRVVLVVMVVVIAVFVAGWKWTGPKSQPTKGALPAAALSHGSLVSPDGWSWGGGNDE